MSEKCEKCDHGEHAPGECEVLYVYARGPNDPPGNRRCLCGYVFEDLPFQSNDGKDIE